MIDVNFDRIVFAVLRHVEKGLALVFVNMEGRPSVTKTALSTYDMITKSHPEGWRKIIGVYGEGVTRQMIEDDLMFLGYRPE